LKIGSVESAFFVSGIVPEKSPWVTEQGIGGVLENGAGGLKVGERPTGKMIRILTQLQNSKGQKDH